MSLRPAHTRLHAAAAALFCSLALTSTATATEPTAPDSSTEAGTTYVDSPTGGSFAAVSPDRQWLVSGEWDLQNRLQVFPTPVFNQAAPPAGGALPQAGQINLDRPVRDIQGCDFLSATRLVCASDDATRSLWPVERPLFQADLERPLDGGEVTGGVSVLFAIPQRSDCPAETGYFETEGVDYDTRSRTLRVEMIPPGACVGSTTVYSYRPAGWRRTA